ncbi:MAG: hypothetical protein KAS32_14420 [Candidatus Peribacteraceae bacterium]|nr:hypothetical protein [Candidatus Peribacteraceae bacterium]
MLVRKKDVKMQLEVLFTAAELEEKKLKIVENLLKIDDLEGEIKPLNTEKGNLNKNNKYLSQEVDKGTYETDVKCEESFDDARSWYTCVRKDTGVIVEERNMFSHEKQTELDL